MCGITGILAYRDSASPIDHIELLQVRDAMVNRGPRRIGFMVVRGSARWVGASTAFYD